MQLRRISEGATPSVQLNIGHGWIDVREILARLSPRVPEDKVANWSSNLVALLGAPPGLRADLAGAARELPPNTSRETGRSNYTVRAALLSRFHALRKARCRCSARLCQMLQAKTRAYRPDLRGP